jgi:hypothetical protein
MDGSSVPLGEPTAVREAVARRLSITSALGGAVLVAAASAMSVSAQEVERIVTISHGSVTAGTVYVDLGEPGPSVGDVRAFSVDATDDSGRAGRLTATLTTSSADWPAEGDELRLADIVMMFGDGLADQLVITGAALYPADSSTITAGGSTIRPIGGGSGIWSGAHGYVETIHSPDDTSSLYGLLAWKDQVGWEAAGGPIQWRVVKRPAAWWGLPERRVRAW